MHIPRIGALHRAPLNKIPTRIRTAAANNRATRFLSALSRAATSGSVDNLPATSSMAVLSALSRLKARRPARGLEDHPSRRMHAALRAQRESRLRDPVDWPGESFQELLGVIEVCPAPSSRTCQALQVSCSTLEYRRPTPGLERAGFAGAVFQSARRDRRLPRRAGRCAAQRSSMARHGAAERYRQSARRRGQSARAKA